MAYAILDILKQFVNEKSTFFDFFSFLWMYRKFGQNGLVFAHFCLKWAKMTKNEKNSKN